MVLHGPVHPESLNEWNGINLFLFNHLRAIQKPLIVDFAFDTIAPGYRQLTFKKQWRI